LAPESNPDLVPSKWLVARSGIRRGELIFGGAESLIDDAGKM
jgi:hypothetical protein